MIVRCPDCRSTYEVTTPRVPESGVKVRCPKCKAVFPVAPGSSGEGRPPAGSEEAAASPAPEVQPAAVPARGGNGSRPRRPITDPALARRMARAMISEMLLNHRRERDDCLERDEVLSRFGPAIVSAFELYREKVSPDLPVASRLFREAVNDILGDGRRLL